jgi:hypothetical protein
MRAIQFFRRSTRPTGARFDDVGVIYVTKDDQEQHMAWADLREVEIVTTSRGPWAGDFTWILRGVGPLAECSIPSGAPGMGALFARLQDLPEFDNDVVLQAVTSTTDRRFKCWTRNPSRRARP